MAKEYLLSKIHKPSDLKNLTDKELIQLSDEIREKIVETVAQNGGHLASNLGVVELTLALHRVFDVPNDKIVWDVGHQCYAHKILTGRCEQIHTIRTENGLSGFPKRSESDCDCFDTGHSSTSISAALGIACSDTMQQNEHYTIAVIGDGALSGGMAYEGLNNAGRSGKKLIVILNDNKMSISQNVGSMARYLSRIRIKPSYLLAKTKVHRLERVPLVGKPVTNGMKRLKDWMAARGIYPSNAAVPLSSGAYCEFGDFANLMKVIEHVWLGGGEKARKLLGVRGEPSGGDALVEIDGAELSFADIKLENCQIFQN